MSDMRAILTLNPEIGNLCEVSIEWFDTMLSHLERHERRNNEGLLELIRGFEFFLKTLNSLIDKEKSLRVGEINFVEHGDANTKEFLESPVGQYHPDRDEMLKDIHEKTVHVQELSRMVDSQMFIILKYQVDKMTSLLRRAKKLKEKTFDTL
jgi:hypothetical protein